MKQKENYRHTAIMQRFNQVSWELKAGFRRQDEANRLLQKTSRRNQSKMMKAMQSTKRPLHSSTNIPFSQPRNRRKKRKWESTVVKVEPLDQYYMLSLNERFCKKKSGDGENSLSGMLNQRKQAEKFQYDDIPSIENLVSDLDQESNYFDELHDLIFSPRDTIPQHIEAQRKRKISKLKKVMLQNHKKQLEDKKQAKKRRMNLLKSSFSHHGAVIGKARQLHHIGKEIHQKKEKERRENDILYKTKNKYWNKDAFRQEFEKNMPSQESQRHKQMAKEVANLVVGSEKAEELSSDDDYQPDMKIIEEQIPKLDIERIRNTPKTGKTLNTPVHIKRSKSRNGRPHSRSSVIPPRSQSKMNSNSPSNSSAALSSSRSNKKSSRSSSVYSENSVASSQSSQTSMASSTEDNPLQIIAQEEEEETPEEEMRRKKQEELERKKREEKRQQYLLEQQQPQQQSEPSSLEPVQEPSRKLQIFKRPSVTQDDLDTSGLPRNNSFTRRDPNAPIQAKGYQPPTFAKAGRPLLKPAKKKRKKKRRSTAGTTDKPKQQQQKNLNLLSAVGEESSM